MADNPKAHGQTVDVASLSVQQLSSLKKRLDEELEHLASSFAKLRAAQTKFRECLTSIREGVSKKSAGKPLLVPLTTSLYVPGTLADPNHVMVDVGTGFFVEKDTKDALQFYNLKIEGLAKNLKDLENMVQGKSNSLRVVEDVLRQKMIINNGDTSLSSSQPKT